MKNIVIILFCILLPVTTNAQQLLTLEKCRNMALENNKQSAIAARMSEKASYDVNAYRAYFFPTFSANGMYLYSSNKLKTEIPLSEALSLLPDIPLELDLSNTYVLGLQVQQPLYMGGKIRAAYRMSTIGKEMSETNRELTRTEVIMQTDEAYWTCVKVRELHLSAIAYKEVIEELLRNVENAQSVGLKQRNDVLKVQVKLNEAELQLRRAENAIRLARMNLCQIIGLPLESPIIVSGSFPENNGNNHLPAADISLRPEYILLSQQIDLKKQETKLTRSDFLPNLGVSASYNYINGLSLNGNKMLDKSGFTAIASVSIPLFEWGKGINKVKAARVDETIAQLKRLDMEEKMTLEIAQALNLLDEAHFETELTDRSVQQAEENMKVSKNMYDAGMETLADYLEAQTVWQKANTDYINAKASLQYCLTKYKKVAGKL